MADINATKEIYKNVDNVYDLINKNKHNVLWLMQQLINVPSAPLVMGTDFVNFADLATKVNQNEFVNLNINGSIIMGYIDHKDNDDMSITGFVLPAAADNTKHKAYTEGVPAFKANIYYGATQLAEKWTLHSQNANARFSIGAGNPITNIYTSGPFTAYNVSDGRLYLGIKIGSTIYGFSMKFGGDPTPIKVGAFTFVTPDGSNVTGGTVIGAPAAAPDGLTSLEYTVDFNNFAQLTAKVDAGKAYLIEHDNDFIMGECIADADPLVFSGSRYDHTTGKTYFGKVQISNALVLSGGKAIPDPAKPLVLEYNQDFHNIAELVAKTQDDTPVTIIKGDQTITGVVSYHGHDSLVISAGGRFDSGQQKNYYGNIDIDNALNVTGGNEIPSAAAGAAGKTVFFDAGQFDQLKSELAPGAIVEIRISTGGIPQQNKDGVCFGMVKNISAGQILMIGFATFVFNPNDNFFGQFAINETQLVVKQ